MMELRLTVVYSVFMESKHGQRGIVHLAVGRREGNSGHSQSSSRKKHNFDKRAATTTFFQFSPFSHARQPVPCPGAAKCFTIFGEDDVIPQFVSCK